MAGKQTAAPPPPQGGAQGHNYDLSREALAEIEQLTREIQGLERDRNSINESIGERRAKIKAHGIDMDAWRAAKRRKEMDPDDRKNFDRSQAMCNAALGVPIQGNLFGDDVEEGGGLPATLN